MRLHDRSWLLALMALALSGAAPLGALALEDSESGAVCRPTPECHRDCNAEARRVRSACFEAGETRRECRARGRLQRRACLASECRPEPSCEEDCMAQAASHLRQCLAAGGTAERCRGEAQQAREVCEILGCRPGGCYCPHVFKPVCGEDGRTYDNACRAACADVEVVHEGPCRDPECRPVVCRLFCEHGFAVDENGCEVCRCAPPPRCPPLICQLACEHGFAKDENGCDVCSCAPPPRR